MRLLKRSLVGALATVLAMVEPAMASPVGVWEIEMGDSRYRVEMCGDGTELCGTLIWLGGGADNRDNRPYLNTLMIDHAKPAGRNRWKGELHLYGQSAGGTITQESDDLIRLKGCVAFIVCKSYDLYRVGD